MFKIYGRELLANQIAAINKEIGRASCRERVLMPV